MPRFHFRRITDAVHGTFGISELESDIISTKAFQRLHNVKQLGLAHLVYPDLNYSRFAHSLGACHIAGRMMRAININCPQFTFDDAQVQLYRLAGLLHDLGHYPFSHAMEHVIEDHYKETLLAPAEGAEVAPSAAEAESDDPPAFGHELLGRRIIELDPEIGAVLDKHRFSREQLKSAFTQEAPGSLATLVSSDLDCDRLDYLMRTARHAGLPYGSVDAEYIIGQTCVDSEGQVCLTGKALRAADHLLVSRYFDYTQVVFHKTVVALEEVLKDVIGELLSRGLLDCSAKAMRQSIQSGAFSNFDDAFIIEKLRALLPALKAPEDKPLHTKIRSILDRRAPKLVLSSERIDSREQERVREHQDRVDRIREKIGQWSGQFDIPVSLWHLWPIKLTMTKIGSHIPLSLAEERGYEEEAHQSVRILTTRADDPHSHSVPMIEQGQALMKQLSNDRYYAIRLYVHLEGDEGAVRAKRREIEAQVKHDLPNFPFSL